ncbi:MAG: sigma-E processing peptidase SpoIIGA [Oscillospiraceae bacterium]
MESVVYIDILFILNFMINGVLIFVTSLLIKFDLKIWRQILASAISALYSAIMFFPELTYMYTFLGKILFTVGLVAITFKTRTIREFLKAFLVFFMVSFAFGGATFAVMFFSHYGDVLGAVMSNGTLYFDMDIGTLITAIILAYVSVIAFKRICVRKFSRDSIILPVMIIDSLNTELTIKALIDTGCELKDPLTNSPILIIESKVMENMKFNAETRFEIPYQTVQGNTSTMEVFRPQCIHIASEMYRINPKTMIGITTASMSSDRLYDAIMNPECTIVTVPQKTGSKML